MNVIFLPGCRHDILGHYLKAIGLLRVLAKCADDDHRDPDAEGWWNTNKACFCLCSAKYPTREKLVEFFEKHYQPSSIFADLSSKGASVKRSTNFSLTDYLVDAASKVGGAVPDEASAGEALAAYRDAQKSVHAELVDSISAPRFVSGSDNPLFLSKGRTSGKGHIWSSFGEYVDAFEKLRKQKSKKSLHALITAAIDAESSTGRAAKGKGTPFFPDAIKAYNIGSGWVTENYPFNALDYVLAVEGGFAMRGSVGRALAANSKRFAAFPFVFDAGEEMVDDANEVKGTSSALWFPLWDRPVTFAELASFITDAQARLPGKDARFSAEFMRALHSQGVDAGFRGWQEFRFKMKISRVPWATTGDYVESSFRDDATRLNRALHPLDEAGFLEQFAWDPARRSKRSPHRTLEELNATVETATRETTPHHCLDLLCVVFRACRQMAISESFRDMLPGKRARFFRPLPMDEWNVLLAGLEHQPEFRIARAVASTVGGMKQPDGRFSEVLPMLGSLLPLTLGPGGWYLPTKGDRSHQAVWTGTDVCHDLAAVLSRRYLDSLTDERPALVSCFGAPLGDVLAFLRGDLDAHLIAHWIEALSLIGWKLVKVDGTRPAEEPDAPAIPPEYAALRTLLELECERQEQGDTKKRRSQQPISLLCQRSASTLPLAVTEALRWIAIWGVPNPNREQAEGGEKRLAGRDIISPRTFSPSTDATRLAAAVCIPLHWRDRDKLYRAVSLPQTD
jgi:CRISPR-associated protein Csx17